MSGKLFTVVGLSLSLNLLVADDGQDRVKLA